VAFTQESYFGPSIPVHVPGVPDELLDPAHSWGDPEAYHAKASDLAARFVKNFERFADQASQEVVAAGPQMASPVR
jgi:phosphoenolpyruvate carboxykinase (ATP)